MQREEMEAWARFRGVEILRFHTDLDESGAKLTRSASEEHGELAQLTEDSREGKVPFAIALSGASEEVDRIVRQALRRRCIELPALV
jgi:hypothetical protein